MMRLIVFLRCILFALTCCVLTVPSAWAYEQTHTCYPKSDGRKPSCSKKQKSLPIQWKSGCTTWRTHEEFPDEYLEALQRSFETWNEVSGSYFQAFYAGSSDQFGAAYDCEGGTENQNVVSYLTEWPSSVAGSDVVALTSVVYITDKGEILDADIRMNADHFIWQDITKVSQDRRIVDVQNILTHEVGHFLGLEHSTDENYVGSGEARDATMWSHTNMNEIKRRVLSDDDKAGVRAIYPDAEAPESTCTPPERLTHAASSSVFDPNRGRCMQSKRGCSVGGGSSPYSSLGLGMMLLWMLRLRRRSRSA